MPPSRPHRRKPEAGFSKSSRLAYERALAHVADLQHDGVVPYWVKEEVPEAWDTLEADVDVWERKVQISLRLDESVAKFYRAMGPGYQGRINRILATFAQMRIAQINTLERRLAVERAERRAAEALGEDGGEE